MSERRETADVRIMIRVPASLARLLDERAEEEGRTRSMTARRILARELLGEEGEKKIADKG